MRDDLFVEEKRLELPAFFLCEKKIRKCSDYNREPGCGRISATPIVQQPYWHHPWPLISQLLRHSWGLSRAGTSNRLIDLSSSSFRVVPIPQANRRSSHFTALPTSNPSNSDMAVVSAFEPATHIYPYKRVPINLALELGHGYQSAHPYVPSIRISPGSSLLQFRFVR